MGMARCCLAYIYRARGDDSCDEGEYLYLGGHVDEQHFNRNNWDSLEGIVRNSTAHKAFVLIRFI
jgi:hypothetical protein